MLLWLVFTRLRPANSAANETTALRNSTLWLAYSIRHRLTKWATSDMATVINNSGFVLGWGGTIQCGHSPGKPGKHEKSRNLRVVRKESGRIGKVREMCSCMHEIWPIGTRENYWTCCPRCQILRLKCTKFDFGWGSTQTPLGELTALPQTLYLDLSGPTSKRGEGRNSELFHWSLLKNTVVIVVTVYMSIAVRNNTHFVLYRYCCEGRYSVNILLKCLEKSGNLIILESGHPDNCSLRFSLSGKFLIARNFSCRKYQIWDLKSPIFGEFRGRFLNFELP